MQDNKKMIADFCNSRLMTLIELVRYKGTSMTILCVINFIFSIVAVLGNILVLNALRKVSSIPKNIKMLLLSLAVSDLAIGLTVQPIFSVIIATIRNTMDRDRLGFLCPTILIIPVFFSYFLATATYLTVTAIALDRLLALYLHLRYNDIVTPRRMVTLIIIIWTFCGAVALIYIIFPSQSNFVVGSIEVAGILFTAVAYVYISRVAQHHRKEIRSEQRIQNHQAIELERVRNSAFGTMYVFFVLLACYIPLLCAVVTLAVFGNAVSILVFRYFAMFVVFLNSSLNPLIYCWRYREIREEIKKVVRDMFHKFTDGVA